MKYLIIFLSLIVCSFTNPILAQKIDQNSSKVFFEISNARVNTTTGAFSGMNGKIKFDPLDVSSASFDACIDAATIDTGLEMRDDHLKNEDYFDVERYKTICISSTSIQKRENDYVLMGTMTMHGMTKDILMPFTYQNNTFTGTMTIDRTDFKVGPSGAFLVGKDVDLEIICILK